jgi:hypothetical protein
MLTKLENSKKFKQELEYFKTEIANIFAEDIKSYAQKLLNNIVKQSKLIDEGHSSRNNGNIDPRMLRDNVEQLSQLRKELNQLIKDAIR